MTVTVKRIFVCGPCDRSFEIEVVENKQDAQKKNIKLYPITCPNCGGTKIFDPKK
jgi:DNA-directed RNA polymerase subunit RPC12/RpoP